MVDAKKENEEESRGVSLVVDIVSDERVWLEAYAAIRPTYGIAKENAPLIAAAAAKEADLAVEEFKKRFRAEDEEPEEKEEEVKMGPDGLPIAPPPPMFRKKPS